MTTLDPLEQVYMRPLADDAPERVLNWCAPPLFEGNVVPLEPHLRRQRSRPHEDALDKRSTHTRAP